MDNHDVEDLPYGERYVAFLDILGFKTLVEEADKHRDSLKTVLVSLNAFRKVLGSYKASDLRYSQFSDSVIVSAPRSEAGMTYIFAACIRIAAELLKAGVLVRGAVVLGNVMHTDDVAFGPAIADAYRSDASGSPPRILVSKKIIDDGRANGLLVDKWPRALIEDDYDGQWMLNSVLFAFTARPGLTAVFDEESGSLVANTIRAYCNAERYPPPVVAKWRWFRRYWNDAVDENGFLARA